MPDPNEPYQAAAPAELFQPCLLERLKKSRTSGTVSDEDYLKDVQQNLEWLFCSRPYPWKEDISSGKMKESPAWCRSVIRYGMNQFSGALAADTERMKRELKRTILLYEPRLLPSKIGITVNIVRNLVRFEIEALLWRPGNPEPISGTWTLDLETHHWQSGR